MMGKGADALGIYISIPFCRSKCTYCNFASGTYPATEHERYVRRLVEDIQGSAEWAEAFKLDLPRRVDTIYLGGGTPSLLEPALLDKLFAAIQTTFQVDADAEITMECAPGQLPDEILDAMAKAGVNRTSLGVQSFIDSEARSSGRMHTQKIVVEDIERLRAAGISNINVDLIAGLAGQTLASWEESLHILLSTQVAHASIYMLEVDEDSRLGRELLKGGARYGAGLVPNDEAIATMYERGIESLAQHGLEQYEISNFAQAGFQSRHNLRYWNRRPYVGFGLDASSALRADPRQGSEADFVARSSMTDDLGEYLAGGTAPQIAWLDPYQQHEEAWFLGLRLNTGLNIAALEREFGREQIAPALEIAKRLQSDGLLTLDRKIARLTSRGKMISNDVFQQFLELPALGRQASL